MLFIKTPQSLRELINSPLVALHTVYTRDSQYLRRNPIENRAISGFSGQKSGTRIILSISQSFLHFLKAKDINNCLK